MTTEGCWARGMRQLFVLLVLLSACAARQPPRPSWRGHHVDELLKAWGVPTQETTLTTGERVLTWRSQWTASGPDFVVGGHWVAGETCTVTATVDPAGIVTGGHYENCQQAPPPPPGLKNEVRGD